MQQNNGNDQETQLNEEMTDEINEAEVVEEVLETEVVENDNILKELNECKNSFTRLSADFQNYKKRVEKEKSDIYQFGCEKLAVDILPVIDNLDRAVESSKDNSEGKAILEGLDMVMKQLKDALNKHGIKEMESLNTEFDPNLHHAVMQEETDDVEENTVTAVFQKGYTLHSKVIRPAMVKVSK